MNAEREEEEENRREEKRSKEEREEKKASIYSFLVLRLSMQDRRKKAFVQTRDPYTLLFLSC